MAPDGSCSYKHKLFVAPHGSQWLPMTPNDSHRVSLLPYHYPKAQRWRDAAEIYEDALQVSWCYLS